MGWRVIQAKTLLASLLAPAPSTTSAASRPITISKRKSDAKDSGVDDPKQKLLR